MNLKTTLLFIALSMSTVCLVACTTEDDIVDNKSDLTTIQITSENDEIDNGSDANTIKISYAEDGRTVYDIPIKMMSEEEYQKANEGKIFCTDNEPIPYSSRSAREPVSIKPRDNWFDVTLSNNILDVHYSTTYVFEFPLNPKAYHMSYACEPDEHPGESRGKASSFELEASLDIVKKNGEKNYAYSHTVKLKAYIKNNSIIVENVMNPR